MSELAKCKTCHKEVSQTAITCPHCGESSPAEKEETTVCPYCKEKVKKGALTCSHCGGNLLYQAYPQIAIGIIGGGIVGLILASPTNIFKQGVFSLNALMRVTLYMVGLGIAGAFIGAISTLGLNKIVFKGKIATATLVIILLIPLAFAALLFWYPKPAPQDLSVVTQENLGNKAIGDTLNLNGLLVDKNGRKVALINGKNYYEGEAIGDTKIEKIGEGYIEITASGQKKNVKIGEGF